MPDSPAPSGPRGLDERIRVRLERAGDRFRAADGERAAALAELHAAVREADGALTAGYAERLTGLPKELLSALQPELGDGAF